MEIASASLISGHSKVVQVGFHLGIISSDNVKIGSVYKTTYNNKIMYFEISAVAYTGGNKYIVSATQVGYYNMAIKNKDFDTKDFFHNHSDLVLEDDIEALKNLQTERYYC